ncbi:hypothetical protein [Beijerinckia sp. L45]|uniref:hypothetical protein n=1 Tax=Beijerinckia sp. L45 TaxID=1641855 RepID=UPI00131B67E8|nr:hypothetical protein [Beijerinckia sp. L45]
METAQALELALRQNAVLLLCFRGFTSTMSAQQRNAARDAVLTALSDPINIAEARKLDGFELELRRMADLLFG